MALEEKPGSIKRTPINKRGSKKRERRVPQSGWQKAVARTLTITAFVVLVYISFTFFQVYTTAHSDDVGKKTRADAIVVLGAAQYNGTPSPVLKARLDHALELYKKGVASYVIVTGGNQPGDTTTEAATSANYLLNNGVTDEHILREVQGVSTYDSLRDTAAFTKARDINKVLIVTDGFHELRATLIAEDFGLKAIGSPAKDSPIKGMDEWKNFINETGRVSLGRIIGFRRVSRDSTLVHFVQ